MKKTILVMISMMIAAPSLADENDGNILPRHIREEIAEHVLTPCADAVSDGMKATSRDMWGDLMDINIQAVEWLADNEQRIANESDISERYRLYREALDICIDGVDKAGESR